MYLAYTSRNTVLKTIVQIVGCNPLLGNKIVLVGHSQKF